MGSLLDFAPGQPNWAFLEPAVMQFCWSPCFPRAFEAPLGFPSNKTLKSKRPNHMEVRLANLIDLLIKKLI